MRGAFLSPQTSESWRGGPSWKGRRALLCCQSRVKLFFASLSCQGLLPRGEKPNPLRQKNARVNHLLKASLPRLPNVQLLDVDVGFVHSDGTISYHDMFDFLHLTGGGYAKVCKPLHELIMQLLEETPEEKRAALA